MTTPEIVYEARPIATKLAQEIAEIANKRGGNPAQFGGLVATLVAQNIAVTLAWQQFPPGSRQGAEFITAFFQAARHDALERWAKPDLRAAEPGSKLS